jgi:hypothetical protein
VQYAKNQKIWLRRPDKLAADVTGDLEELRFRYDGKQASIYNPRTKSWGAVDAPAAVPETLDMLAQKYGVIMPLEDLTFPDPYATLTENVRSGQYIGEGFVFDTKCDHLAFRQGTVDWQMWIDQGDKPLPRKVVITFKDQPGFPEYTAFLSDWNLSPKVDDQTFATAAPAGAKKVEFAAPPTSAAPGTGGTGGAGEAGGTGGAAQPTSGSGGAR